MPDALLDASDPAGAAGRRRSFWLLAGFSILYFAWTGVLAARTPLWFDELFTFHLARLPRLADLWSALASGTDLPPPLVYLATRFSQGLLGDGPLGTRLPGMVGFWVMSLCLFSFVRRRCPLSFALAALLLPLATLAYPYGYFARPYGLVLGFSGLALVCWQAAEGRRALALPGLALSLAAAFLSHYYAVLLLGPLALGEVVRSRARRRWDRGVWLAFGAGVASLALVLPLLETARTAMGAIGTRPAWRSLPGIYAFLLGPVKWPLLAVLAGAACYPKRPTEAADPGARLPAHEIAAALGLIALPAAGVLATRIVPHPLTVRYILPTVLGFGILVPFFLYRRTAGSRLAAVGLVGVLMVTFAWRTRDDFRRAGRENAGLRRTLAFLQGQGDLPVAVANPIVFFQLAHYAPPPLAARLFYLTAGEASSQVHRDDPAGWALILLQKWVPVGAVDCARFVAGHPHFLMYGNSGRLRPALEGAGERFTVAGRNRGTVLFAVSRPSP